MKLAIADRPIERISTQAERHFTIKATGKAFRILSSGLYKDKVLAVIRELSCNAYDAHVAAGCPSRPFDIHLPNAIEPFFSVRDYGPALSPHQIETVFTTYFESTKTDSNDQIGGLGLGCKSPLSYVDSFTVISRHDGIKRTYTVFFNEDDTPSMTQMSENDITGDLWEATGLEIVLPVRQYDYREFKEKAERVYRYFDVLPNVVGNPDFKVAKAPVVFKGENYYICDNNEHARAIMGVVSYPVDGGNLGLNQAGRDLVYSAVDLRFNVGDLDITAGREELSYDKRTKELLQARIGQILGEIPVRVMRQFSQCKTEFEARKLYGSLILKFNFIKSVFPKGNVPFKGKLIGSNVFELDLKKDYNTATFLHYDLYNNSRYTTHTSASYRDNDRLRLMANDALVIVYDDLKGIHTTTRIKQYKLDHKETNVFVLRTNDPVELQKVKDRLSGVPFINISTLPKSPTVARQPTSVLRLSDWYRKQGSANGKESWERVTVDPSQGGIYVPTSAGVIQNGEKNADNFPLMFRKATGLGLFDSASIELYSIPKSLSKRFLKDEDAGWVNFFDHVREEFKQKMVAEKWNEAITKARSVAKFRERFSKVYEDRQFLKRVAEAIPGHPLNDFFVTLAACTTEKNYTDHIDLSLWLKVPITGIQPELDVCAMWEQVGSQYGMLDYMFNTYQYNRDQQKFLRDAVEYVAAHDHWKKLHST